MSHKPTSWNEIKKNVTPFIHKWKNESRERAEAQSFLNDFFQIFGINRSRVASFERPIKKLDGNTGFIDAFWPGVLLVEMKSQGQDLEKACDQAFNYFSGLDDSELPKYVMVSDFARIRLMSLHENWQKEFPLEDLSKNLRLFGFIAGYESRKYEEQDPVNLKAATKMGVLHDRLREAGYGGHDLQVYLVRLLFCLFADDTGIFNRDSFFELIKNRSSSDGSDLAGLLNSIFETLNTPIDKRMTVLDADIAALPYVNGRLFEERLRQAAFDADMRTILLDACKLDWGAISPAIFGSLFQSIMDDEQRRNLGAHYTSEKNIMKLIGPLFLDDLWNEFSKIKGSTSQLNQFHQKLASLRFFDPACGCGNFLIIAYRELRRLEHAVLQELQKHQHGQRFYNIETLVRLDVDMMYGIEVEEFPAQIAQVALWLIDHQMNVEVAESFGEYFRRLPLKKSPNILHANALQTDWTSCFDKAQPEQFDFIFGNPPFIGKTFQSKEQRHDMKTVMKGVKAYGRLDYVSAWFIKSAKYMQQHPSTRTAFVATNSISQGEQVSILWSELYSKYKTHIHFGHRTFQWQNEASGQAAVHVVIIGFAVVDIDKKRLFDYETPKGDPQETSVRLLSPYLTEGSEKVVEKQRKPICPGLPPMRCGNKPTDGGHLILSPEEKAELIAAEPAAAQFVRQYVGSHEYINGVDRYCLWLLDATPSQLRSMPNVLKRIQSVREMRLNSSAAPTQKAADRPSQFFYISQPTHEYLAIPEVSSEHRLYIPMGFLPKHVIASNKIFTLPTSSRYIFSILTSAMHMTWVRHIGGRLESRYSYSGSIIYNTFPWPNEPDEKRKKAIEQAAESLLSIRQKELDKGQTLADLYDPNVMPEALIKAHRRLDRLVDLLYRPQPFPRESHRMAHLFERHDAIIQKHKLEKA